jgi:hypothetical protein
VGVSRDPVYCYRCRLPGHVDWCDVSAFGDAEPVYIRGESYCTTPGCTDADGSRRLEPLSPAEMMRRGDDLWLAGQLALVRDRA